MRQRHRRRGLVQHPVRQSPPVLTPSHLDGVGQQVLAADVDPLAQRAELQIRFREALGRGAKDRAELLAWVAGARIERPVVPRSSLLEQHLD